MALNEVLILQLILVVNFTTLGGWAVISVLRRFKKLSKDSIEIYKWIVFFLFPALNSLQFDLDYSLDLPFIRTAQSFQWMEHS